MVPSAATNPPKTPPIIHGKPACGAGEGDKPQVHAAVATTKSRRSPVLLTVPCSVIASPNATWSLKAFSLSAGLDVRIRFAIGVSLLITNISLRRLEPKFKIGRRVPDSQFPVGALLVQVTAGRNHEGIIGRRTFLRQRLNK